MGRCVCVREVERRSQRDWLFCNFFYETETEINCTGHRIRKKSSLRRLRKRAGVNFIH
jgi:hypothetical protein